VFAADFVGPTILMALRYGSLLPPTQIYWRNSAGQFVGPHIYPTTQGPDLETGDRKLIVDRQKPSWLSLFTRTDLPTVSAEFATAPKFEEVEIFSGIPAICTCLAQLGGNLIFGNRRAGSRPIQ